MNSISSYLIHKDLKNSIDKVKFRETKINLTKHYDSRSLKSNFSIYILDNELFALYKNNTDMFIEMQNSINKELVISYCRIMSVKNGKVLLFLSPKWHKTLMILKDYSSFWTAYIKSFE